MDYYSADDFDYYEEEEEEEEEYEVDDDLAEYDDSKSPVPMKPPFRVIKQESLLAAQKQDLQKVMDFTSLKEHHARTLLVHFDWNPDRVLIELAERGDDWLCRVAGVSPEKRVSDIVPRSLTCEICFDKVHGRDSTAMDCGHRFCNDCWTEHFAVKINYGQSASVTCMAHKCGAACDTEVVRNLVRARDPTLAEKFDRFLLESYIDGNRTVKWCPSVPHCGNAVGVEDDELTEVECDCRQEFCFSCVSEAHSPCTCLMWESWTRKCVELSETVTWLVKNTKDCPKCRKPVEKNGGCNLVYCVCKQAFCWLCGEATGIRHTWTSIEGHTCGKFKDAKGAEDVECGRRNMIRYTHYYTRYKAHRESMKLESDLKETLRAKIAALSSVENGERDFTWVEAGFNMLLRLRKIISYSYPFAFYMFGNELFKDGLTKQQRDTKKNLFEDQQQQLEAMTERLSMFLEEPFSEYPRDQIWETRRKILALAKAADDYCRGLYDCIEGDLFDPIYQKVRLSIAPYRSPMGMSKASELY